MAHHLRLGSCPGYVVSTYLSKTDFKVAQTCATKLYYKKLGYPSTRDNDEYLQFLADGGYMVEAIAKLLHPEGIEVGFEKGPEESAAETMRLLQAHDTITLFEATILSGQKLARVDILRKQGNDLDLIEVKAKLANPFRGANGNITSEWRPYLEDVAFQHAVLQQLFPKANVVPYLCLVDKAKTTTIESIFSKFQLSESSLSSARFRRPKVTFTGDIEELRRSHFLSQINVAGEVRDLLPEVERSSADFLESLQGGVTKIQVPLNVRCRGCEYRLRSNFVPGDSQASKNGFLECWGELANVDPHILDYYQVSRIGPPNAPLANSLISRRRVRMSDINEADLVGANGIPTKINTRQRIQRKYTLENAEYLNPNLVRRLQGRAYPLHFIDFETSTVAVPYHAGMHPYEVVAFQWSCHTIREKGADLEHTEWINVVDAFPNFAFAEALMEQLGNRGSFLMWSLHENTILNVIRAQMRRYRYSNGRLERWLDFVTKRDRNPSPFIVDMCALAKEGYFHPKMRGRLSLKDVLPAVWESNEELQNDPMFLKYYKRALDGTLINPYDTLPALPFGNPDEGEGETENVVTEGTGAMRAYQEMLYGVTRNDDAIKHNWRRLLLQYCELDTAAMVMVWMHWTKRSSRK
jgi:Domain of unknown function(DUF2779)